MSRYTREFRKETVALLENIGGLLKLATLGELDKVFHALFERVYINRKHPGHIYAIEPKPPLHRLMDISLLPRLPDHDNDPDGGGSSGSDPCRSRFRHHKRRIK
jgi:hypothetical protein